MSRPSLRRILVTALFLFALTVPSVRAVEPESSRARGFSLMNLLDHAWGGLVSLWMENGCSVDPNGSCTAGQAGDPRPDNGCGLDPDGRYATGQSESGLMPAQDNGCGADPDGRCRSGS